MTESSEAAYDLTNIPYEQLRDELMRRSECFVFIARMVINKERAPHGNIVSGFRGYEYEAMGMAFDMASKIKESLRPPRVTSGQDSDWLVCTQCDVAVGLKHKEACYNSLYSPYVLPDHCVKKELDG